ncbi:hypothetical protein ALP50_02020 [Pseudomonas syringae pv. spinaceae]|nr:hypothetical protein ALP50_02020 [Pseudomonas syringae pv. spinaceae]
MRQYLQVMSGTENAINKQSSVGNRYRDGWGFRLYASTMPQRCGVTGNSRYLWFS